MKYQEKLQHYTVTRRLIFSVIIFCLGIFIAIGIITGYYLSTISISQDVFPFLLRTYLISAVLFSTIGYFFANHFMKTKVQDPILFLKWLSDKMAKGDYTFVANQDKLKKDEFGEVIISFNKVIKETRNLIDKVYGSLSLLTGALDTLGDTVEQTSKASNEILKSSEEIANGATEQAVTTEKGVEKSLSLGEMVSETSQLVEGVDEVSNHILQLVDDGMIQIHDLSDKVYEADESIQLISDVVIKTNKSAIDIKEASDIISSIAEQTNLLALNAAIEASRAGESGKGFAVVADEIRNLAERSTESTKKIDSIIKELQSNSSGAIDAMNSTKQVIHQQVEYVGTTKNKFEEIINSIDENRLVVDSLKNSSSKMNVIKDDILSIMENLSAIAEENAASTEESIASIQEQTAAMQSLSAEFEKIDLLNKELNSVIMFFKTKKKKKKKKESIA